ncbi:hypothetical protein Nepgr_030718 [Nepenthes gracilis]|uniref:Exostosin GT47 domain-containing protein n=1 Tax=Nepenthes gracilis TaxID=150966 RepID=A0AAD3Y630_NEPGR|nr:hypothetical protein Nepgr_030718 [Nepenthes gracilis]
MAIAISKKKSKRPQEQERKELSYPSRTPAILLLLFLLFLWSSSTTFITGSIVHVCVTSRKLGNLYCLSAGSQRADFEMPLPLMNITSEISNPQTQQLAGKNPLNVRDNTGKEAIDIAREASVSTTERRSVGFPVIRSWVDKVKVKVTRNAPISDVNSTSNGAPIITSGSDKALEEEIASARKDVEGQMEVLRSYIPKKNHSGCVGRGIYVYELPPKFNKDLINQCNEMLPWIDFCKFFANKAFGEPVATLGSGWYNTHQYSLEPIFHSRALKHPCRVHNADEAKLFYVPFYGGLDILRWHFKNNVSDHVKDKLSFELIEWLRLQKSWTRKSGLDHVFVLGKITWDFRRKEQTSWGTRLLEHEEMQNPMKLLIERQPWHLNEVAIPHPTFFHPRSDSETAAWQNKIMQAHRKSLISFAGAARPQATDSIRSILIQQCNSTQKCTFLDCKKSVCSNPAAIVELFSGSEFCLQPPGDSPTRKSVFDSLVSGCIPVLFDPFTAYYQYAWHLPADSRKYSVFIDQEEVRRRKAAVAERLMRISLKEREEMRRFIVYDLLPGLIYSDPDAKLERFEDAFTITMNNLLEKVNSLP